MAWQQECRVVKSMGAQGAPADSAALAAARIARDEAEQQWRRAQRPHPLATRMGWAQQRLDKAERALTKVRYEQEAYEEEVAKRRKEIDARNEEADRRYRWRQEQLEELHAEAGGVCKAKADDNQCDMLAREVRALVENIDEGTAARGQANLLLAKIDR